MSIKIGNGEISTEILLLPKAEFLSTLPLEFKRVLLLGKSDEEIEQILGDLWVASNPQTDGSNISSKKTKGTKQPVGGTDTAEPIGDGGLLNGAEQSPA